MTSRITRRGAAELLGVYPSTVAKMIDRGDLTGHGRRAGGSLDLADVEALAARRASAAREAEHALARRLIAADAAHIRPPDSEHDWLSVPEVAKRLGMTRQGVAKRCERDALPYSWASRRRWIRRDLLELIERAKSIQPTQDR